MISLRDYEGREQSYVKHVFLEQYLEALAHKTASIYNHIVYVDGFAGPWQSAHESFEDTSFGIALSALRRAKASWTARGREVKMSAFLVEKDPAAYAKLISIPSAYPDVEITTYNADFMRVAPRILADIPPDAFVFFLIDPKGWGIPLKALEPLLARQKSEVIFNFMFDFINRAASMKDPLIAAGLDELMPYGDFRQKLADAEESNPSGLSSEQRKDVLVAAFAASLSRLGNYKYVAETTVLRPVRDRPLYCLFHATRHRKGIEVFRDCQGRALAEQSRTRATTKVKHVQQSTGQNELFASLHDMGPDELTEFLEGQRAAARTTILAMTPPAPGSISYGELWPSVLTRHIVRLIDVNRIVAELRTEGVVRIPGWEPRKRVPDDHYAMQRAPNRLA